MTVAPELPPVLARRRGSRRPRVVVDRTPAGVVALVEPPRPRGPLAPAPSVVVPAAPVEPGIGREHRPADPASHRPSRRRPAPDRSTRGASPAGPDVPAATVAAGTRPAAGAAGATRTAGTAGTRPATGAAGATGTAGTRPAAGAAGTAGTCPAAGATGETGAAGTTPATGATRASGATGLAGPTALAGTTPAAGATRATRATGLSGLTGAAGVAGGAPVGVRPERTRAVVSRPVGARVVRPAPGHLRLTRRGRLVTAAATLLIAVLTLVGVVSRAGTLRETAPVPASAPAQVVVAPGETLWSIAERVAPDRDPRTVVAGIQRLNDLPTSDVRAGQTLLLRTP